MKNKSPLLVIICLFILMAGCSANNNNLGNNTIPGKEEEEYGKYSHSGRIVKIDNNGYQVKNDEGVNFFNVGEKSLNNFYVGEYVRLNSLDGKIYDAALDEKYDYTSVFNTADFLDEANKLELKVVDISRDITGAMRISGRASDNREYDIAAVFEAQAVLKNETQAILKNTD